MHHGSAMVTQLSILKATSFSIPKTREYGHCCSDLTLEIKHTHTVRGLEQSMSVTALKLKEQTNYPSTLVVLFCRDKTNILKQGCSNKH